jgi:V8-like Glu-specific endopeptidase
MIDPKVISRVRNGVCAVGYLTVPLEEYKRNIQSPFFQVVGTGFLVRETTVITNRHVIQGLFEEQVNFGFPSSQFFLSFVAPQESPQPQITIRMIRRFGALANEELDVGFLEFKVVTEAHFYDISPLDIASSFDLQVSEEIAVCGYPYGTLMLMKNAKVYRWGPVIQRGFISAISPFDTATEPDQILLDVRTASGMSGAPIFKPSDGKVIGIHHSGWEATTAMGLPLTKQNVEAWLDLYDNEQNAADRNQVGSGLPNIAST